MRLQTCLPPFLCLVFGFVSAVSSPIAAEMKKGNIPDPSLSSVTFPERLPAVSYLVTVEALVKGQLGPVSFAKVEAIIVLESGELDPDQEPSEWTWSNDEGQASIRFPNGIKGVATVRLAVYADGILLSTSDSYTITTGSKLALHAKARVGETCGSSAPTDTPCSQFITSGTLRTATDVYIIVANVEPSRGVSAISCGVDYEGQTGEGVDVLTWTRCASGLDFTDDVWPGPGGGARLSWVFPEDCQTTAVSGYEDEGAYAIAGAFYVYAYGEDTLALTPNSAIGVELAVGNCDGSISDLSTSAVGAVRFSESGMDPGYNPCTREGVPPSPPPPPPPIPLPDPRDAAVMLHIGEVAGPGPACTRAPESISQVVTSAAANPDGTARYFVYLLGISEIPPTEDPENPSDPLGLAGMQLGIEYDVSLGPSEGVKVFEWNYCSDLEFSDDDWPASGSGNTITWVTPENCSVSDVVVAGYFYVSAYTPSVMSIIGFPHNTGVVKVANCEIEETVLEVIPMDQVGWVSLGGAGRGIDTDGCNPVLEPCLGGTPVRSTTWGQIKTKYGN